MTTYSLGSLGIVPGQCVNASYQIPDADMGGAVCSTPAGMAHIMTHANLMLVKGPDGAQHWYRYDSERSTPANPILLYVGP